MKSFKMLMMAALTMLSVAVFAQDTTTKKNKEQETEKAKYVCPMHPEVMMDKAGKCVKCGMDLHLSHKEKMDSMKLYTCPMHADVTSNKPGNCPQCNSKMKMKTMHTYTCPMHPDVTQDKPGKCPTCGMDLKETEKDVKEKKDSSSTHKH